MYARLVFIPLATGALSREQLDRMASQITSRMRQLQGFHSILLLLDEQRCEVGALSLWDSQEALEAATPVLDQMARSGVAAGTPTIRLFEVYEPST